eukprot:12497271-Alexandrium_andersonii.AAC.1
MGSALALALGSERGIAGCLGSTAAQVPLALLHGWLRRPALWVQAPPEATWPVSGAVCRA